MDFNTIENLKYCREFVEGVTPMLMYSHIPTALMTLLFGYFVFIKSRKSILGRILLIFSFLFFAWVVSNLFIWLGYSNNSLLMFLWSTIEIFSVGVFFSAFYFLYVFVKKEDVPLKYKLTGFILFLPVIVLAPTSYSLLGFDIVECVGIDSYWYGHYVDLLKIILSFGVLFFSLKSIFINKISKDEKRHIVVLLVGLLMFLLSFLVAGMISQVTSDYRFEFFGLFGVLLFLAVLLYLTVQIKAFNFKLFGAQVLVPALWFLVGSLYFIVSSGVPRLIVVITFLISLLFGLLLIRSIRQEVKQKEFLEGLKNALEETNKKLADADARKSEFLAFASHQLRTPLTSMKWGLEVLTEKFGSMNLSDEAWTIISHLRSTTKDLTSTVNDLLDISKIDQGGLIMKNEPFDVIEFLSRLTEEFRITAEMKHLKLSFEPSKAEAIIMGDQTKLRQVFVNLIDNAIKYTPVGSIRVIVEEKKAGVLTISIIDTGPGISKEEIDELFDKFIRGKAGKASGSGSGLGLHLAKKIVTLHKGSIKVESAGENKGSAFIVEVPLYNGV